MRRIECKTYAECLEKVAKENKRDFSCDGCTGYLWEDPTLEEETNIPKKEEVMEGEIRTCTKCGKEKAIEEFSKGAGKDGRKAQCRKCDADYFQDYKVRKRFGKVKPRKGALRKRMVKSIKTAMRQAKDGAGAAMAEPPPKIHEEFALKRAVELLIRCGCLSEAKLKAAMELSGG